MSGPCRTSVQTQTFLSEKQLRGGVKNEFVILFWAFKINWWVDVELLRFICC